MPPIELGFDIYNINFVDNRGGLMLECEIGWCPRCNSIFEKDEGCPECGFVFGISVGDLNQITGFMKFIIIRLDSVVL